MFGTLKKAWQASQARLMQEQFRKAYFLIYETTDALPIGTTNPQALYTINTASRLRVEVRMLKTYLKHDAVPSLRKAVSESKAVATLAEEQKARIECVLLHLEQDPDCM